MVDGVRRRQGGAVKRLSRLRESARLRPMLQGMDDLTERLPEPPTFGAPLPIAPRNQAVLDFLALRRSASAWAISDGSLA